MLGQSNSTSIMKSDIYSPIETKPQFFVNRWYILHLISTKFFCLDSNEKVEHQARLTKKQQLQTFYVNSKQ